MKINQIIMKESEVSEIAFTKRGREQKRAFKQGKQTLKLTTDNLTKEFAEYLGSQGKKNFKQATTQDVVAFLDGKNVDTSDIANAEPMTPKRMAKIFQVKSQEAVAGRGGKKPATPAPQFRSTRQVDLPQNVTSVLGNLSPEQKAQVIRMLSQS